MIAPFVVSVIVILYYFLYFGVLMALTGGVLRIVLGIIPLVLSAAVIAVCIERINEIKKGEEDDIGKY